MFEFMFVGYEGDLILPHCQLKLWRLDVSKQEWVHGCRDNQMIVDNTTTAMHLLSIPAVGNAKGFRGVIHLS